MILYDIIKALKRPAWWGINGGPSGIRTQGGMTLAGFQDRCIRPTLPKIHVVLKVLTIKLEVPPRFELGIAALQAAALPLGDGTSFSFYQWCPGPDSNRHSIATGGF